MKTVRVNLDERSYPIFIGNGILHDAGAWVRRQGISEQKALIVSQKEIAVLYEKTLLESLKKEGIDASVFLTPASKSSEAAKSEAVFWKLIQKIASEDGKNKSLFLVALGGGVIGDLAGFAASVYRRGIPYVQIPTTLTAQVDSAIGGKTAIDLKEGKNLLGAIYQPRLVLSDTAVLKSLPDKRLSEGFAEVIKYGVIQDTALFSLLEKIGKERLVQNSKHLERVIERCVRIKSRVVSLDEQDKKNLRIILNFGHTAGHALEAASSFSHQYTHGEAVAIGMLVACDIAANLGILKDPALPARLETLLIKFGLPVFYKNLETKAILEAMGYDKKSQAGKNRFILPVRLGKTQISSDVPISVITEALLKRKR